MEATLLPPPAAAAEHPTVPIEDRGPTAVRIASELVAQEPDWITFFREVLGVDGLVRRLFPTVNELAAFQQTDDYAELQRMLQQLRTRGADDDEGIECQRVITVRMPKSVHSSLKADAARLVTSMNQLCINRLLKLEDVLTADAAG